MNNSFERLIDGMIEALQREVIPHTQGEYARGQAFGVIFVLKNLRLRAAWSPAFLAEQIAALAELAAGLDAIAEWPAEAPRLTLAASGNAPSEAARDSGDAELAALIDWLAGHRADIPPDAVATAESAIDSYLKRQIRHEIATSAKPMFAEISLGREIDLEPNRC